MKPLPALLLLAACSHELDLPAYTVSSLGHNSIEPRLVRLSAAAEAATHTTPWADSRTRNGTTFYSRGRVVTTVEVLTDSMWSLQPPVTLGLPSGPFNLPPDSLCTLGYSTTTLAVIYTRVLRDLQRTRECGARTFAQIRRSKLKDSTGKLSVQTARAELDTWPWPGLCGRVQDSTIIAFYIGDDVEAAEWGPAKLPARLAQWDSIAGIIQARCPGAPVAIRAHPNQLEARGDWLWLTTAWTQYTNRRGPPEEFLALQVASAKRQRLGLVAGVNLLNGGCGPAERKRCLPDVPGTTLPGTQPQFYQLSAAELIYYKTVALSEPYVCASVDWSWGPAFRSSFHERPEIRSAAKILGLIARKRPLSSCIQR
jgi:hypothetical protein